MLTLGFLGRHDDPLPFQVQGSSVAPLDSYPFLDLWYLSCDVVVKEPTQVGDAPGYDCSQLTVCIDVKRRRSCADRQAWAAYSRCLFLLSEGGVYGVFL